jgi:hypothetical protein
MVDLRTINLSGNPQIGNMSGCAFQQNHSRLQRSSMFMSSSSLVAGCINIVLAAPFGSLSHSRGAYFLLS